ncbi:helix-turn-helix domain-containing protein, partial [Clostridium perfringens]
ALASDLNLARSEETLVAAALKRHAFNVSRAAAELGLTRAALYRRMARYGL